MGEVRTLLLYAKAPPPRATAAAVPPVRPRNALRLIRRLLPPLGLLWRLLVSGPLCCLTIRPDLSMLPLGFLSSHFDSDGSFYPLVTLGRIREPRLAETRTAPVLVRG